MDRRAWVIVGLFASIAATLAGWLLLSQADPATEAALDRAEARAGGGVTRPKLDRGMKTKLSLDPQRPSIRELANRQNAMGRPMIPIDPSRIKPVHEPVDIEPGVFALDQEGVTAAVQERRKDLEGCYETALFHTPGLSGTMTLTLEIVPKEGERWATVASVDTDATTDAAVFEGCVQTVFEELRFDATEPTTIRYPVVFDAEEQ